MQGLAPRYKLRIRRKLFALDSSLVSLCLSAFPWARYRKRKGAIKLHTLLDLNGSLPVFACVSEGKTHDARAARRIPLPNDSLLVIDRAYIDYVWLKSLLDRGVRFITRLKKNAAYRVVGRRKADRTSGILCDQTILLTGPITKNKYPEPLRRIAYRDPETGKRLVFLTNDFTLAPLSVAKIYKARWQIELFFKWIKQNLKIKTFLGTSANAVQTQIWIALIAYLVLAWMKFRSKSGRSLQQIKRLLETTLFERRALDALIRGDWEKPPPPQPLPQLQLGI